MELYQRTKKKKKAMNMKKNPYGHVYAVYSFSGFDNNDL